MALSSLASISWPIIWFVGTESKEDFFSQFPCVFWSFSKWLFNPLLNCLFKFYVSSPWWVIVLHKFCSLNVSLNLHQEPYLPCEQTCQTWASNTVCWNSVISLREYPAKFEAEAHGISCYCKFEEFAHNSWCYFHGYLYIMGNFNEDLIHPSDVMQVYHHGKFWGFWNLIVLHIFKVKYRLTDCIKLEALEQSLNLLLKLTRFL